jgi:hypothetical protein
MAPSSENQRSGSDGAAREAALRDAIEAKTVAFAEVVRLKHAQMLDGSENSGRRELGNRYYDDALAAFKAKRGGPHANVAVFAESGCGVYALPDGAVALPAGGIGALMSVLQRMTSGRMRLDVHAGRGMLTFYGAVRPFVGGIFGMAVFVLIAGGLVSAIEVTGAPLPFYAGVGFLTGFSERLAQDMLAGASTQLGGRGRPDDADAGDEAGLAPAR